MHAENLPRNENQQIYCHQIANNYWESSKKWKPTNILSLNRYQLLEPTSENTELVSENIQNTDALRLSGKKMN